MILIPISVISELPGTNNVIISGDFVAKFFDGGYNAIPQFMKE